MKKNTLSVVLATYNEEQNLARCLSSIKDIAWEIIVVDGNSSDNTVSIASDFGAKIIHTSNKANFHINKNMAIDAALGSWILQLDADETVSPELAREITYNLQLTTNEHSGYWLPRLNYFLGKPLRKGGQYPDYTLRLYRRGYGRLPAKDVHEQAVVTGKTDFLKENLLHYNTPDFENYLLRYNRYTSLLAAQYHEKKISINIFSFLKYFIIKPVYEFIMIYFRHKGFLDGFPGFIFAQFSGLRFAIAYIKYWQISKYKSK